jgi:hypothetical protein
MELFTTLDLLTFHAPTNLDHPGTTLHEIGAAVVVTKWALGTFMSGWVPLDVSVFEHSDDYLHAINLVLNLIIGIGMYFAARTISVVTGAVAPAFVLQASYFLFWVPTLSQGRVSPEPSLTGILYLLMILLALNIWTEPEQDPRITAAAGAAFGLLLVTKLSVLPLASVLILFRGRREILRFCGGAAAAAALVSLPVIPRIPTAIGYSWRFFFRSGCYGEEALGVPSGSTLLANITEIFLRSPFCRFLRYCASAFLHTSYLHQPERVGPQIPRYSGLLCFPV